MQIGVEVASYIAVGDWCKLYFAHEKCIFS